MDKKTALLYSKINQYKYLVKKTSGFIKWALSKIENPYVACSFGKDSAVMLHLILQHNPNIPVRFVRWKNETEFIDNYDEIINQWGNINLEQIVLCRSSLNQIIKDRYSVSGYDSYFIGLRKEESTDRRLTLKANGIFFKNKDGLIRISPLADWSHADVSTYMFSNNLPILNSYLVNGSLSRTASRIPRADYGIREQFLSEMKSRDPHSFYQLLSNFPEIKNYV